MTTDDEEVDARCLFIGPAKDFYESQSADVQADLVSIAAWLFVDRVEGERKAFVEVPGHANVRQYRRMYQDEKYRIWYDRSPDAGGVHRLYVYDCEYLTAAP
jgi:hypothetical protein